MSRHAPVGATALVCLSHSPLIPVVEPKPGVRGKVESALASARRFIADFAPDLIVLFGPDHYNGMLYELMPPFCIGAAAISIGDYGLPAGPLSVDHDAAEVLAKNVLDAEVDVAFSERMFVDHGFVQPLQLLFGAIDAVPLVPVFVNSAAEPLGPPRRARRLGDAIGCAASGLGRRVLFVGSGGLSHDPPIPKLRGAPPEVAERLISEGRRLTLEQRADREARTADAARAFAAGTSPIRPLNPVWDRQVLDTLASGDLAAVDSWTTEWFVAEGGHSSHETRTWIAAYAALATAGPYRVTSRFYEPIPEWIAGFAITQAESARVAA